MQFGRGCCLWGGVCPFLPPACSGEWAGPQRLALLWDVQSFVLGTGQQCVQLALECFSLVNFLSLSLAVPQFKLLSHVSSLQLPSGHSGPVLTLSNAACCSPFSPHLLVSDTSVWGTFLLGVVFRHVIYGFYLFFLPVRLLSEI